jgi:hypothetical protein
MNSSCLGAAERTCFDALEQSSGFRFNRQVQYSWSTRRAVNEGLLTLSILRDEVRLRLLAAWMRSPENLLDFVAKHLPNPSAELSVCRFERLALCAHSASHCFKAPDPAGFDGRRLVERARNAGLAVFQNEPTLLVAPGLPLLCRIASPAEKRLWGRLATPCGLASLMEEGLPRETIESMLQVGALEYAC